MCFVANKLAMLTLAMYLITQRREGMVRVLNNEVSVDRVKVSVLIEILFTGNGGRGHGC